MFKILIGGTFLLIAGIAALRRYLHNEKMKSAGNELAQHLDAGNMDVETLSTELSMTIRRKRVTDDSIKASNIAKAVSTDLDSKFSILNTREGNNNDAVIIANARVTNIEGSYNGTRDIEVIYPCWLYITPVVEDSTIEFRSMIPHDKDHQFILEDLADHAFLMATKMEVNSV
jgi:hypothetical protein